MTLRKTLGKLWKPLVGVNICAIGFVAVFPIVELNVNCPPAITSPYWNTLCLQTKNLLWHSVYELSLKVADDYPPMIWENDGLDRTLNNIKSLFIFLPHKVGIIFFNITGFWSRLGNGKRVEARAVSSPV